jgi:hypothetical protein
MAKPRKVREQNAADFISGGDLDASMFWFGDLNMWGAFPSAPTVYQKPRAAVFYMARNWFERQVFLKAITLLKFDLYNYGFKLQAAIPSGGITDKADKAAWDKDNAKVQKWFEANKLQVTKFTRDAWQEWFVQDNAIAVWTKQTPPVIYPVEHLTYHDDFGIEMLSFAHNLTPLRIDQLPGLSFAAREAMKADKNITLQKQGRTNTNNIFQFESLKRTKVGMGLAWPQIRTLFNSVCTWESMELADWQLADSLRTVYEMHLVGHEIRNGPRAGFSDHFLKSKRARAINEIIKQKRDTLATVKRLVVNFDHKIEYPRPDPKHFGQDRYEAPLQRFMYWAMPIADMLYAKQMNPWQGNFLKAKAHTEREYVGPFIEAVLKSAMGAPEGITCTWTDDLFSDPRLMLDTLKTGLAGGPLSQQTFLDKTGVSNTHTEHARKTFEKGLPKHITHPAFDAAHGDEAGRPTGKADGQKRKPK